MAKPKFNDVGKYTLPTMVGVTVKSHGKRSGYIILTLSGQEELRMPIYSTVVDSFTYVLHPFHRQNILTLTQGMPKSHPVMTSRISFILVLNLFPLNWENCEFKDKLFPFIHPACNDEPGTG